MKIKKIVGACVAVASMALMSVAAQAAVYSVSSSGLDSSNNVSINVKAKPNTEGTEEDINGFAVKVSYDKRYLTPSNEGIENDATGAARYATTTLNGVLVADLLDGSTDNEGIVAVAWANKEATTINAETVLATIKFAADKTAADAANVTSTNLTITVVDYAQSATEKGTSSKGDDGVATFTVTVIFGDLDNDELITANDVEVGLGWLNLGETAYTAAQKVLIDVDGDEIVTANDIELILKKLNTGDSYKFPVEG